MSKLNARFQQIDIIQFYTHKNIDINRNTYNYTRSTARHPRGSSQYYIESSNGELLKQQIHWETSADVFLESIADALRACKDADLNVPTPPLSSLPETANSNSAEEEIESSGMLYDSYDDRYNINSNSGRNLMSFLSILDPKEVERRKTCRIDAAEAARNVKMLYQFEAVDVTRINWSPENLSKSLSSLSHMHREHAQKFKVQSFYPLHLVLSSSSDDDSNNQERVCVYGGTVLLNPGATPLQWLRVIMLVQAEHLAEVKQKREDLSTYVRKIQEVLPVKLRKGATCSARDYHYCLRGMAECVAEMLNTDDNDENNDDASSKLSISSSSLTHAAPVTIYVEALGSYRRAIVTKDGIIRVGADITADSLISTCQRLSEEVSSKRQKAEQTDVKCRQAMKRVKETFELLYLRRQPRSTVTNEQILTSLGRLLEMRQNLREHEILKKQLYRNSVRIAASGQLCQLGSDGSIVLPWDWQ